MARRDSIAAAARALEGARDKNAPGAAARVRRAIDARIDNIIKVVLDAADAGDVNAIRLVVERVLPVARSAPLAKPVQLDGDPGAQAARVKELLAAGQLTLEDAEALLSSIEAAQRIKDNGELVDRLAQLERQLASLGQPVPDVIDAEAEAVPAGLPAPRGGRDEF
jgi:hypothetical protein